jgi:hypothetical protein
MSDEREQNSEYYRSKQPVRTLDSHAGYEGDTHQSPDGMLPGLPGLMRSAGIGVRCNTSVRAEGMRQLQQTHGNRAVQRLVAATPSKGRVAIQRDLWDDIEAYQEEQLRKRERVKPGEQARGHNYVKKNEAGGYEQGMSGRSSSGDIGGVPVETDFLYDKVELGAWDDDGSTRYGVKGGAGVFRGEVNKGGNWSADLEVGTANAELSAGKNGASVGAGATGIGGSVTLGEISKESNIDEQSRYGLSAGPSIGLRGHWGDSDGDGYREYGGGADFGPFSFDVKTEDPVRTAFNSALSRNLPGLGGGLSSKTRDLIRDKSGNKSTDEPTNWTQEVLRPINPMEMAQAEMARRKKAQEEERKRAVEEQQAKKEAVATFQKILTGGAMPNSSMDSSSMAPTLDPSVAGPAPLWQEVSQ